ncbi:MAG: glycoside hydrolase family 88 protein [Chitinophagaceae bacterium]|nr:glycoside hydrolase family 88 protein [Chitinophagaceae bacterium]
MLLIRPVKLFSLTMSLLLFGSNGSLAQYPSNTVSVKLSNAILSRWNTTASAGRVCIDKMTAKGWEYSNSIVLHGIEKVYEKLDPVTYQSYLTYVKAYIDDYVDAGGNIVSGEMAENLDKIHPGISVLFLYEHYKSISATDSLRYRTAATYLRNYLIGPASTYPKTAEGGYYHKNNATYTNVMMLDGIYMAHPFLARYGRIFNDPVALDTAANQALLLASHLHNSSIHLLYHAYDYARTRTWASAATGISYEVWSRGMGWYVMALVDILKYLPHAHPKYNSLLVLLQDLAIGIQANQDPGTGLWYQIVNKPAGSPANYLETSGSAMFVYAIKTAVDSGWISNSYSTVAQNGWNGILSKVSTHADGGPQVNDFAPAMGVQGTSAANAYTAYVNILPVDVPGTAHPHGYAAVLMAASVMELSGMSTLPLQFSYARGSNSNGYTQLQWAFEEEDQVAYYKIDKAETLGLFTENATVNANHQSEYSWQDSQPIHGYNFYRIRAVTLTGKIIYSPVIRIQDRMQEGLQLLLYPNPASSQQYLHLQFTGMVPGQYSFMLSNAAGNMVWNKLFSCNANNGSETLLLPVPLPTGFYIITVNDQRKKIFTRKVLIR